MKDVLMLKSGLLVDILMSGSDSRKNGLDPQHLHITGIQYIRAVDPDSQSAFNMRIRNRIQ